MKRRAFLATLASLSTMRLAYGRDSVDAILYKNPQCGCCGDHAAYLRRHGYRVTEVPTHDLDALRQKHGVPEPLYGCHMILVAGYVVEGHVSATVIDRLLRERPKICGVSLPGMPAGSPGMSGNKAEPFQIYEISVSAPARPRIYAIE